jgi:hypothetical protein
MALANCLVPTASCQLLLANCHLHRFDNVSLVMGLLMGGLMSIVKLDGDELGNDGV